MSAERGPKPQVGEAPHALARITPEQFAASGDTVIVIGRERVRVKATGDVLDEQSAHVMQVRDGQVADFREIIDTAALVAASARTAARV